jgi:hypothetical protein
MRLLDLEAIASSQPGRWPEASGEGQLHGKGALSRWRPESDLADFSQKPTLAACC